jgi:hypothetical protein
MRPANLLIPNSTYVWQNPGEDLSESINIFQLAFEKVARNEDQLFCMPDLWEQSINDEVFIQVLANYDLAVTMFPWLLQSQQRFLIDTLLNYPLNATNSITLEELDIEFEQENNGIMQLGASEEQRYVYDETSWYALHWGYLGTNNSYIDWGQHEVLPGFAYSKLLIATLINKIEPTIDDEQEAVIHFETHIIRSNRLSDGEKIQFAESIAIANGYQENRELSSKESMLVKSRRKIFVVTKNGHKQYLSLDFENWQFEVCDHRGKHIGVWNFSGRKTEPADNKGKHDLRCLR